MRNLRFNIASILGVILCLAIGFAALRESNDYWDSGLFTLTLGVLLVSVLLSIHRSEVKQAFWIGFALFGWGYLGLSPVPSVESRLLTTKGPRSSLAQRRQLGNYCRILAVVLRRDSVENLRVVMSGLATDTLGFNPVVCQCLP
jgi:hypothetical protein